MIDIASIIARQLACRQPEVFDGQTELTPVLFAPIPDDSRLSLDGDWQWDTRTVRQPGKVFYSDPAGQPDRPDWDRVTLAHLDERESALLRRSITLPAAWRGKRIFLRFDAVYPAARFFCDGELLGVHTSGLTPWECEITAAARFDRPMEIGVEILRKHRFIQLDMPRHALEFGGMAQSACLFATAAARLGSDTLDTVYDHATRRGVLTGVLRLDAPAPGELTVAIARDGVTVAEWRTAVCAANSDYPVELTVEAPDTWSDEFPRLYDLTIAYQGMSYRRRIGFRELRLSPSGATLNGNFVKFRGVNHLTFHPEGGLYTPKEWLRQSLSLMKKANINAIRTHFTAPEALAELCDEMGFYLLQEIPIDWGTHFIHDPAWVGPALHRIQAVIRRDHAHPSLVVWSVGNENMPESAAVAAAGWHHLRLFECFVRTLDAHRATMFPPPGPANAIDGIFELRYGDIADVHYSFKFTREFLETGSCELPNSWEADKVRITREAALARGWSGMWFSSEWGLFNLIPDLLNNPGGSLIADCGADIFSGEATVEVFRRRLADEWGFMRGERSCLGGAYFPWLSAAASATAAENPWGWMRYAEDADWGVVTADLLPKPEFWALRQAFSPVHFPARVEWDGGAEIAFEVENQFNAIDLAECTFRVQCTEAGAWMTMLRHFTDVAVTAAPGARGAVRFALSESRQQVLRDGGALLVRITLLKPDGFRVTTAETLVRSAAVLQTAAQAVPIGPDAKL